ncbi:MAG: zinc ribbon domain-containing protein [Anaerolineae bacterium]|nr:zinc ribbon domain-containing protein [Anaerolineae bacterium]
MPIYEYYCPACHGRFSALQKIGDPPPPCPRCQNAGVEKLISAAGLVRTEAQHKAAFEAQRSQVDPEDKQEIARFFRDTSKELAGRYEGEVAASDAFEELLDRAERGATEADLTDLEDPLVEAVDSPYKMLGPDSDPETEAAKELARQHEYWPSRKRNPRSADNLGWA